VTTNVKFGLPAQALSREYYTSPEWFRMDLDRIYARHWLFVCHISEVPNSGDYHTYELGEDSVIVARDRKGGINAFYNICRHRGTRICDAGQGNAKLFVCPFHNWAYNLDGSLRGAPYMSGLDKTQYGAKPVRSEVWNGLIFINLADDAASRPVADVMSCADISGHCLDRAKVIAAKDYAIKANWKINAETFQECYHCTPIHSESLAKIQVDDREYYKAYEDQGQQSEDDGGEEFLIYSSDMRQGAFAPGVETETLDGKLASKKLLGDTRQPPRLISWFPNFSVGAFPDYAFVIDWIPVSALETKFRTRWLVHQDAVEGTDYEVAKIIEMAEKFNSEDKRIVERQQQGVNSRGYQPGPYNVPLETDTRKWMAQYLREVSS
jgi:phenylpropionate dioxygenase-like ring-hydroxylating dioxygenase large terminal subunit